MALLVIGLLAAQGGAEALKKIEEALAKPDSLSVSFKASATQTTESGTILAHASGRLQFKKGGKSRQELSMIQGGSKADLVMVSDGLRLRTQLAGRSMDIELPSNYASNQFLALARVGVLPTGLLSPQIRKVRQIRTGLSELDVQKDLLISEAELGTSEGGSGLLIYTLSAPELKRDFACRTWYSLETFRPVRRELHARQPGYEELYAETYEGWSEDEIPEGSFETSR